MKFNKLPEHLIIRDFISSDFSDLMNLWAQTDLGGAFRGDNLEIIFESIDLGGKLLIVIEKNNKALIGSAWMTYDGRRIHLHHFGIAPNYQGQGIGKYLTQRCLNFAKLKQRQIKLEVHRENKHAIKLYSEFGFNNLGEYDVYIVRNL